MYGAMADGAWNLLEQARRGGLDAMIAVLASSSPAERPAPPPSAAPRSAPSFQRLVVWLEARSVDEEAAAARALRRAAPDLSMLLVPAGEGADIADRLVRGGCQTVMVAGDDALFGEVATLLREAAAAASSDGLDVQPPALGLLRLGGSSGVAETLGASPPGLKGYAMDLWRVRVSPPEGRLWPLEVEGRLLPYATLGLQPLALARGLIERRPEIVVRNLGPAARDLRSGVRLPAGGVLYRGRPLWVAAGVVPYVGAGARLLPDCSGLEPQMQVRIFDGSMFSLVRQLPALWRGEAEAPGELHDFVGSRISVEVTAGEALPVELAGRPAGYRSRLELAVSDEPLRVAL
jgi:diacylglycerol kinase family enzyme